MGLANINYIIVPAHLEKYSHKPTRRIPRCSSPYSSHLHRAAVLLSSERQPLLEGNAPD